MHTTRTIRQFRPEEQLRGGHPRQRSRADQPPSPHPSETALHPARFRGMAAALFPFVFSLSILCTATNADASAQAVDEARDFLSRAQQHYRDGDYEVAAGLFLAAWERHPLPALLFNIAQAYRLSGRQEEAREWYERFLREEPDAPNRREVELRIDQLTRSIERHRSMQPRTLVDPRADIAGATRILETAEVEGRARPPSVSRSKVATESTSTTSTSEGMRATPERLSAAEPTRTVVASRSMTHSDAPGTPELPSSSKDDAWWDSGVGLSDPSSQQAPTWHKHLPLVLAGTAAAFAVGGAISYAVAHRNWNDAMSVERARWEVDNRIQAGDTAHALSLGFGGTAVLVGAGAVISLAF